MVAVDFTAITVRPTDCRGGPYPRSPPPAHMLARYFIHPSARDGRMEYVGQGQAWSQMQFTLTLVAHLMAVL